MELNKFITKVITGVVNGVEDSKSGLPKHFKVALAGSRVVHSTGQHAFIEFDVATTAEDTTDTAGGINVLGLKAGIDGSSIDKVATRIKFRVELNDHRG